jgi:hypothetical protein
MWTIRLGQTTDAFYQKGVITTPPRWAASQWAVFRHNRHASQWPWNNRMCSVLNTTTNNHTTCTNNKYLFQNTKINLSLSPGIQSDPSPDSQTAWTSHVMAVWPIWRLGFCLCLQILSIKRPVLFSLKCWELSKTKRRVNYNGVALWILHRRHCNRGLWATFVFRR